jgi:hypothetical protein
MIKLAALLTKILSLVELFIIHRKNADAQKQRDAVESDPFDWFSNHFGGVSAKPDETKSTDETDNKV